MCLTYAAQFSTHTDLLSLVLNKVSVPYCWDSRTVSGTHVWYFPLSPQQLSLQVFSQDATKLSKGLLHITHTTSRHYTCQLSVLTTKVKSRRLEYQYQCLFVKFQKASEMLRKIVGVSRFWKSIQLNKQGQLYVLPPALHPP